MKLVLYRERDANNKQARISASTKPSYSYKISMTVAPCARRLRIYSTVKRVPLIVGFPAITLGFVVIRFSISRSIIYSQVVSNSFCRWFEHQ